MPKISKTYLGVVRESLPGKPTLRDLAEEMGCTHNALANLERGVSMVSEALFRRYCRRLGIPVAQGAQLYRREAVRYHLRMAEKFRAELATGGKSRTRLAAAG